MKFNSIENIAITIFCISVLLVAWPWNIVVLFGVPILYILSGAVTGIYKGLRDAYKYHRKMR